MHQHHHSPAIIHFRAHHRSIHIHQSPLHNHSSPLRLCWIISLKGGTKVSNRSQNTALTPRTSNVQGTVCLRLKVTHFEDETLSFRLSYFLFQTDITSEVGRRRREGHILRTDQNFCDTPESTLFILPVQSAPFTITDQE